MSSARPDIAAAEAAAPIWTEALLTTRFTKTMWLNPLMNAGPIPAANAKWRPLGLPSVPRQKDQRPLMKTSIRDPAAAFLNTFHAKVAKLR